MKKITLFYLLVFFTGVLNAQGLNWSSQIRTNNAKEVVEYIGSANNKNYFISKAAKQNLFYYKTNIYLFSTNANNELVKTGEEIILEKSSIIKAFVKDNDINILLKTIVDGEAIVELVVFDSETLMEKEKEAKDLLKFDVSNRDEVTIYYNESEDKSKYCLNYLSTDYRTNKGYLQFNVFENDNTPLWTNRFENDFEGMLRIYDFQLENSGDVYMYAVNSIPVDRNEKEYKLFIIRANENDTRDSEFDISLNSDISDMSLYKIDSNIIFLATQSEDVLSTYKLDLENQEIASKSNFRILNIDKNFPNWSLDKFYKLENGNLVLPMQHTYAVKYVSNNSVSYVFSNYNMCIALIDPENNELVKKQIIRKAMNYESKRYMEHGYYESPFFYAKGNEFYAIYNNNKKYDDLGTKDTKWILTYGPRGSKKYQTNVFRMDQDGKVKLETLFTMKKDKKMFSAYTTFVNSEGELILSGGNKKGFSFAKYIYK